MKEFILATQFTHKLKVIHYTIRCMYTICSFFCLKIRQFTAHLPLHACIQYIYIQYTVYIQYIYTVYSMHTVSSSPFLHTNLPIKLIQQAAADLHMMAELDATRKFTSLYSTPMECMYKRDKTLIM